MIFTCDAEYPQVCVDARHRYDDPDRLDLTLIDLATSANTIARKPDDDDEMCDGGGKQIENLIDDQILMNVCF